MQLTKRHLEQLASVIILVGTLCLLWGAILTLLITLAARALGM